MPPGGPEDRFPPYVIETVPDTFSVVEPGLRDIFIRFSERISERASGGTLNDAVVVSPTAGQVRVRHRREGIAIHLEEGLLPNRIYRITVLPVVNDMFGNNLRDAFDLVISTGGEFVPNVVAGMVEDRVTGRAVRDVRVEARFFQDDDTLVHWNVSDSAGVFSLRYVPDGEYEVGGWQDRNRDREVGSREPQAAFTPGALATSPDTGFSILTLIEPDTTPPRLARVNIVDSLTLRFEFDDYLEPTAPGETLTGELIIAPAADTAEAAEDSLGPPDFLMLDPAAAARYADSVATARAVDSLVAGQLADSLARAEGLDSIGAAELLDSLLAERLVEPPRVIVVWDTIRVRFFQEHEYTRWQAARADSLETAAQDPDSAAGAGAGDPEAPGTSGDGPAADSLDIPVGLSGLIIPSRTVVGVLDGELPPGVPYAASVAGAVNIYGTGGGEGVDTVMRPPLPPREREDSADAGEDAGGTADSGAPGDTVTPPDTATPPDTVTPPDAARSEPAVMPLEAGVLPRPPSPARIPPAPAAASRGAARSARPPSRPARRIRGLPGR